MKKVLTMLLVAVLAVALVACGGSSAPAAPAAPAPASSAPASSTAPAESTPAESTPAESASGVAEVGSFDDLGMTEGYMGVTSSDEAVCIAFNADWTLAVFVALADDGEYVSFVGEAIDNGDGTVTINDESNGLSLSFGVAELENGNLELDLGDLGTAEVAACEVSEVLEAINAIDESGTAVA